MARSGAVACVDATTAYTDANRASGEQQCNLQKGSTGSRPQGAGGPGPEATQKENQKLQKTRRRKQPTSLGLLEYNCSWERISRLHTAHVLHMYHKSSLHCPSLIRRVGRHVLLVASATASSAADRESDIRDADGRSGPSARSPPRAGRHNYIKIDILV